MRKAVYTMWGFVFCLALFTGFQTSSSADCGSIPFDAPLQNPVEIVRNDNSSLLESGKRAITETAALFSSSRKTSAKSDQKVVRFDPLKVTVFEPQQRAIILWNGNEEILLLSTDQKASQQSNILEVIPLPAEPKVRLGSFETFEAAQKLVVQKRMWATAHGGAKAYLADPQVQQAGRITFQEKMGAHDVAIAQVVDKTRFVEFVQAYLKEHYQTQNAPIRPDFVSVIDSYLKEGFQWFTFDVITLDGTPKSRQPIEYRFASDCVFYPLRISSLEQGKTKVDLLVFTSEGATQFLGLEASRFKRDSRLGVTLSEMESLDPDWKGFFPASSRSLSLDQWGLKGESSKFLVDVKVK